MSARKILIVDDDLKFSAAIRDVLSRAFFVTEAASEAEFRRVYRPYTFDLVVLDMRLETEREGLRVLREILMYDELQPVIMVSAFGDIDSVLDSAEAGALMFLHKHEFTPELLARMVEAILQQARIRRQLVALQSRVPTGDPPLFSGSNASVRRAAELVQSAASDRDCTVLVSGERGMGHKHVARAIHDRSRRRSAAPLVSTTAGMLPMAENSHDLVFGVSQKNGAPRKKGLLEQANGGVLFFGDMEMLDPKVRDELIAALRERLLKSPPPGPPIPLDLQLVVGSSVRASASIADSLRQSATGNRLVEIYLAPLRDRREDIQLLATRFLQECTHAGRTSAKTFMPNALNALESYQWPGNIDELRNAVEFAAIQAFLGDNTEVDLEHLPDNIRRADKGRPTKSHDYRYHMARAEVAFVDQSIAEKRASTKGQFAKILGYTDRFAFGRRLRKALREHKELAREFPRTAALFSQNQKRSKPNTV